MNHKGARMVKDGKNYIYQLNLWQIFLFARLNPPNVLLSIAKYFIDSDFPSPFFNVQKPQISLPVGYKTARPKSGDWERLWSHFRTSSFAKNRFLRHFLIYYKQRTIVPFHSELISSKQENDAWSPEMTSQSFLVSCFWSGGFVPHRKWHLTLLVHQTRGKKIIAIETFSLLYTSVHWRDLIKQIKKILSYTL